MFNNIGYPSCIFESCEYYGLIGMKSFDADNADNVYHEPIYGCTYK